MADTLHPIFYETLAATANCTPAEAMEHLDTIPANTPGLAVQGFLAEFAPNYPEPNLRKLI